MTSPLIHTTPYLERWLGSALGYEGACQRAGLGLTRSPIPAVLGGCSGTDPAAFRSHQQKKITWPKNTSKKKREVLVSSTLKYQLLAFSPLQEFLIKL